MQERELDTQIVVNRWDDTMDVAREFRVFVPPPLARLRGRTFESLVMKNDMKISAISQYRWFSPFVAPYLDHTLEETADRLLCGAQFILEQILDFVEEHMEKEAKDMLVRFGFSFDVVIKEVEGAQLVEINPFGALSGCGACLFNWAIDGRMMYGLEEAVFAVTMDEK